MSHVPTFTQKGVLLPTNKFEAKVTATVSCSRQNSSSQSYEATFPVKPFSSDHTTLIRMHGAGPSNSADHVATVSEYLSEDYKLYLKLLELVSTPAECSISNLPALKISPDVVNRLDRSQGCSPLHYACMNGHLNIGKFLLDNGADVDICDDNKQVTPLICASAFGNIEVVKLLISKNCNIDTGLSTQSSALFWGVRFGYICVVGYLLENRASQITTQPWSDTAIHVAVRFGRFEILGMLLDFLVDIQAEFQSGPEKDTPLHLAASGRGENAVECCKILIERGRVDVNPVNGRKFTPLHVATKGKNAGIVNMLTQHGANANAVNDEGRTPLFYFDDTPESGKCMKILIEKGGCDVNHRDNKGFTPLHEAGILGASNAAEILMLNGADFSMRTNANITALSVLRRKIPNIDEILKKTFDQAVVVSHDSPAEGKSECRVDVDFRHILPAGCTAAEAGDENTRFSFKSLRGKKNCKETAKLKCLVDEDLTSLLLHPVIHGFLEMKWNKSRLILFPTLALKVIVVLLFSAYVQMPYIWAGSYLLPELNCTTVSTVTIQPVPNPAVAVLMDAALPNPNVSIIPQTDTTTTCVGLQGPTPPWFRAMYIVILVLAVLKGLTEIVYILRSPKAQLKTLGPYISLAMTLIMIGYMRPGSWKKAANRIDRHMAALGILLAWIDVWINMSRFPHWGLSIRVFFQVFKNFMRFICPHVCLLLGFWLSLTLIFPDNAEFSSLILTFPKMVRIIAGDITIVAEGQRRFTATDSRREIFAHFLLVYIYTSYIIIVAIVLGNLLIGLAVNDLQGIYAEASIDKLVKQTLLLNTAESGFHNRWLQGCVPIQFLERHVNLFKHSDSKTLKFKPYDTSDSQLSSEQKQALLDVHNPGFEDDAMLEPDAKGVSKKQLHKNAQKWQDVAGKLLLKKEKRESRIASRFPDESTGQSVEAVIENIRKILQDHLSNNSQQN